MGKFKFPELSTAEKLSWATMAPAIGAKLMGKDKWKTESPPTLFEPSISPATGDPNLEYALNQITASENRNIDTARKYAGSDRGMLINTLLSSKSFSDRARSEALGRDSTALIMDRKRAMDQLNTGKQYNNQLINAYHQRVNQAEREDALRTSENIRGTIQSAIDYQSAKEADQRHAAAMEQMANARIDMIWEQDLARYYDSLIRSGTKDMTAEKVQEMVNARRKAGNPNESLKTHRYSKYLLKTGGSLDLKKYPIEASKMNWFTNLLSSLKKK